MPRPVVVLRPTETATEHDVVNALRARFAAVRAELGIDRPYPPKALAEAERVASRPPAAPRDETAVPFVTLDPPGAMDLDQAMHLERDGAGHRIRYAIADVPAFVDLGGALDAATRERGQTVYCPDERVPLHPPVLSEGAASLLPDQVRPAFVWDLRLDGDGALSDAQVYRAVVRSRARLDYRTVQAYVDAGSASEMMVLLRQIGERRIAQEEARGGASLPMPEQEVTQQPNGTFALEFRPPVPAEEWNAQISLLTGMAAATMMIEAKVGILRTMPAPTDEAVARFRRAARGLGVVWEPGVRYGEFLRGLERTNPRHLALIHEATSLFRGASYTPFDGALPEQREHAAVAAPYAHVTAPLRRLVDRFGLLVAEAVCAGREVPEPVRAALPDLVEQMRDSDRVARTAEHACAEATEAAVLAGREGETFEAIVVDHSEKGIEVQLVDLPVLGRASGTTATLGEEIRLTLTVADVRAGQVTFTHP